jgi:hypothetical protein
MITYKSLGEIEQIAEGTRMVSALFLELKKKLFPESQR